MRGFKRSGAHIWPDPPTAGEILIVLYLCQEVSGRRISATSHLDSMERERASRFVRVCDHNRYVLARNLLRQLLAHWLAMEPAAIDFANSEFGKPFLSNRHKKRISFNVSHSGSLIALAFASDACDIGIDVEALSRSKGILDLADKLHPEERAAVREGPGDNQIERFLQIWTRKEAVMKADSRGLGMSLDSFSVLTDIAGSWRIIDVDVPDGYRGAVAFEDRLMPVRLIRQHLPELEILGGH